MLLALLGRKFSTYRSRLKQKVSGCSVLDDHHYVCYEKILTSLQGSFLPITSQSNIEEDDVSEESSQINQIAHRTTESSDDSSSLPSLNDKDINGRANTLDSSHHDLIYPDWIAVMPSDGVLSTIYFANNLVPPMPYLADSLFKAGVRGRDAFYGMSLWNDAQLESFLRYNVKKLDGSAMTELEVCVMFMKFKGYCP